MLRSPSGLRRAAQIPAPPSPSRCSLVPVPPLPTDSAAILPSMDDAIELTGVGVRRGDTWILRDVTWSVPAGTCAAILGPNGSGKSTLTRILAAHLFPSTGDVSILGGK